MNIIIGADFVPTKSNVDFFKTGKMDEIVDVNLLDKLNEADFRIFNLEVPLTDKLLPIDKCGPNLIAPTISIEGYKALNTDLLVLANNHIMDQGVDGLFSTINVLGESNISYVGAGRSLEEAASPYYFEYGGKKIGIYACAEHEFSIASNDMPGANPIDVLESFEHTEQIKEHCDYLIVLYHGGKEHYRYPSPYLQRVCRKFVQKGANLVICQHSHCVGCEEKFDDGIIVYGQGNFLFDGSESEYWQTSLLVQVDEHWNVTYIPIKKNNLGVSLADEEDALAILADFNKRSKQIEQEGFVQKSYDEYAEKVLDDYLSAAAGKGKKNYLFRLLNKLTGYKWQHFCWKQLYRKQDKLKLVNFIECEAHHELFLTGLKNNNY